MITTRKHYCNFRMRNIDRTFIHNEIFYVFPSLICAKPHKICCTSKKVCESRKYDWVQHEKEKQF